MCEDGTRRALTTTPCSWAARPWQGYMANTEVNTRLSRLQTRIQEFYEEGKISSDKELAQKLWFNEKNVVVAKKEKVLPGDHLSRAQYKDVIEREGPTEQKIRCDILFFTSLQFSISQILIASYHSLVYAPVMTSRCGNVR